jgi:hypothetical protein
MNVETPPPPPRSSINAAERARREHEVALARGNVRHEGGILSNEIECLNARDLAAEFASDQLTIAIWTSSVDWEW